MNILGNSIYKFLIYFQQERLTIRLCSLSNIASGNFSYTHCRTLYPSPVLYLMEMDVDGGWDITWNNYTITIAAMPISDGSTISYSPQWISNSVSFINFKGQSFSGSWIIKLDVRLKRAVNRRSERYSNNYIETHVFEKFTSDQSENATFDLPFWKSE